MNDIYPILKHFGIANPVNIESIGNGLIHQTFLVETKNNKFILQQINTTIFKHPLWLQENYQLIYENGSGISTLIPAIVQTQEGALLWEDEHKNSWRVFDYIPSVTLHHTNNNYSLLKKAAYCFGAFTASLKSIQADQLKINLPQFHDLALRYQQMENAIVKAPVFLLMRATHIIAELRQRKNYVTLYQFFLTDPSFKDRVMHHDCKVNNILFHETNGSAICPIDLDTVMPGKFFSDIGDMIRTMATTEDEESRNWEHIEVDPIAYHALMNGYLEAMENEFTQNELKYMHYSGLLLIFMQSIRFVTDFLQGDIYYKINYPEQNLNRSLNQLILLEKLETFIEQEALLPLELQN